MPCAAMSFCQIAGCAMGSVGPIAAQAVHAEGSAGAPRDSRRSAPIQTSRSAKLAPMMCRCDVRGPKAKISRSEYKHYAAGICPGTIVILRLSRTKPTERPG